MEKTLNALKRITDKRLICLFGCGGNRDVGKREIMGEIAGRIADFTIITSDNPRFEDPMEIINNIEKGVLKSSTGYVVIQDRKTATEYGVNMLSVGDVLLIAGKGSENYQDVLGSKHDYNDKLTVAQILRDKGC